LSVNKNAASRDDIRCGYIVARQIRRDLQRLFHPVKRILGAHAFGIALRVPQRRC